MDVKRYLGRILASSAIIVITVLYYNFFKMDWGIVAAYAAGLFSYGKSHDDSTERDHLIKMVSALRERCRSNNIPTDDIGL